MTTAGFLQDQSMGVNQFILQSINQSINHSTCLLMLTVIQVRFVVVRADVSTSQK